MGGKLLSRQNCEGVRLMKNQFGEVVYQKQGDEDVVILCVRHHGTLKPLKILLPHQVYKHDIEKIKEEYRTNDIVCIPAKSSDYTYLLDLPIA